jgi:hypothetical protein
MKNPLDLELSEEIEKERAKKGLFNFTRSKQPFLHNI